MIAYGRTDWRVDLGADGDNAVFRLSVGGQPRSTSTLPRRLLDDAARRGESGALADALRGIAVDEASVPSMRVRPGDTSFSRVTLALAEANWSRIDWESLVPKAACFVRLSDTPPRIAQVPLTFPIRILEAGGEAVVEKALKATFGDSVHDVAMLHAWCPLADVRNTPAARRWSTVEVLHLKGLHPSDGATETPLQWLTRFCEQYQVRLLILEIDPGALADARHLAHRLTAAAGPAVWVLPTDASGWYGEYDLIVHDRPLDWIQAILQSDTPWYGAQRRRDGRGALFGGAGREELLRYSHLARDLQRRRALSDIVSAISRSRPPAPDLETSATERGDILPYLYQLEGDDTQYYRQLRIANALGAAVHSLRLPLARAPDGTPNAIEVPTHLSDRFFADVARGLTAEGLHSPRLEVLIDQARSPPARTERFTLGPPLPRAVRVPLLTQLLVEDARGLASLTQAAARRAVRGSLQRISVLAPKLRYEDQESEGMLPLAASIAQTRALLQAFSEGEPAAGGTGPRRVNCAFFSPRSGGVPAMLEPATARLRAGDLVHFGVRIAREDLKLLTIGSTALIDEIDRSQTAIELDIGLTSIDFECSGEPVQTLRLLPNVDSDWVMFAVRPRKATTEPGVARLRVSIFQNNNLAQSFIVASLLDQGPADPVRAIAFALDAQPSQVRALGELGYVTRMEYSSRAVDDPHAEPRALSIIANRSAGEKIITIKGKDLFRFTRDPNLPDYVRALRNALEAESTEADGQTYAYRHGKGDNGGTREALVGSLWNIADAGFQLFNALVPERDEQTRIREQVAGAPAIHAAHVDLTSVVPWALIYDRPVRKLDWIIDRVTGERRNVAIAVCPAAMPGSDGKLPQGRCEGAGCLLHESETTRRRDAKEDVLLEESVICPRHFWGFSVPIEVPAQQKAGIRTKEPAPMRTQTPAAVPPAFCADFNRHLDFSESHRKKIEGLSVPPLASFLSPHESGRTGLLNMLDSQQPDVVYLFCHALKRKKFGKMLLGPSLDLGLGHVNEIGDLIRPQDFAGKAWSNAPLVFINACAGNGFEAYAPSPFIKQFIQGRGAGAVIGAEVIVWESLAAEFAYEFFSSFLAGESAGQAMLVARGKLLAKFNPLGLVYSLYGSADLRIARDGTLSLAVPSPAQATHS
jgi:hypothetical protein